jgi:hypothetical protein
MNKTNKFSPEVHDQDPGDGPEFAAWLRAMLEKRRQP